MKVRNVHTRTLAVEAASAGPLIDQLASDNDLLWPHEKWPPIRFDRPLQVDATGGHGPIRYFVNHYTPGREVRFTFTAPEGFNGQHVVALESIGEKETRLTHRIEMRISRWALFSWTFVFRPLHDALIEDAFTKAERSLGLPETPVLWSGWVRWLRRRLRRK